MKIGQPLMILTTRMHSRTRRFRKLYVLVLHSSFISSSADCISVIAHFHEAVISRKVELVTSETQPLQLM